jgi:hypothetical protein
MRWTVSGKSGLCSETMSDSAKSSGRLTHSNPKRAQPALGTGVVGPVDLAVECQEERDGVLGDGFRRE